MRSLFIILFTVIFGLIRLSAQDSKSKDTLQVSVYNNHSLKPSAEFLPTIEKYFAVKGPRSIIIEIIYTELNSKMVEGMENIYYKEFLMTMTGYVNSKDVIFSSSRKVKGNGTEDYLARDDAFKKYSTNINFLPSQVDSFYNALHKMKYDECEKILNKPYEDNLLFNKIKYLHYIPKDSKCYKDAQIALKDVEAKYSKFQCTENMHKLRIRAESKTFNRDVLVSQLVKIPKSSPCAQEALEIAKLIGKQEKETLSKENLNRINIYINSYN